MEETRAPGKLATNFNPSDMHVLANTNLEDQACMYAWEMIKII